MPLPLYAYELHGNCYLNLTNRCTLRCRFCPKFNKDWVVKGYELRLPSEPDAETLWQAIGDPARYREVVFCGYGEPTLRLDVMLTLARRIKSADGRTRLNTDGLANLVHGRDVTAELSDGIDAVSVSLNAQDAATYARQCRPPGPDAYPAMLDFVDHVRRHMPDVTVTAIDGLEGVDIPACHAIADRLGVKFRRRVLDEVG